MTTKLLLPLGSVEAVDWLVYADWLEENPGKIKAYRVRRIGRTLQKIHQAGKVPSLVPIADFTTQWSHCSQLIQLENAQHFCCRTRDVRFVGLKTAQHITEQDQFHREPCPVNPATHPSLFLHHQRAWKFFLQVCWQWTHGGVFPERSKS